MKQPGLAPAEEVVAWGGAQAMQAGLGDLGHAGGPGWSRPSSQWPSIQVRPWLSHTLPRPPRARPGRCVDCCLIPAASVTDSQCLAYTSAIPSPLPSWPSNPPLRCPPCLDIPPHMSLPGHSAIYTLSLSSIHGVGARC